MLYKRPLREGSRNFLSLTFSKSRNSKILRTSKLPRGLTLTEMLITVCILGLCLGLTMPHLGSMVASNKERSVAHQLMAFLASARAAALSTSRSVGLCSFVDHTCQPTWKRVSLIDSAQRNHLKLLAASPKLMQFPEQFFARWRGFRRRNIIIFNNTGALASDNGRIFICYAAKKRVRFEIVISPAGRTRIVRNSPPLDRERFSNYCVNAT